MRRISSAAALLIVAKAPEALKIESDSFLSGANKIKNII
jgi:hypothetical protein